MLHLLQRARLFHFKDKYIKETNGHYCNFFVTELQQSFVFASCMFEHNLFWSSLRKMNAEICKLMVGFSIHFL